MHPRTCQRLGKHKKHKHNLEAQQPSNRNRNGNGTTWVEERMNPRTCLMKLLFAMISRSGIRSLAQWRKTALCTASQRSATALELRRASVLVFRPAPAVSKLPHVSLCVYPHSFFSFLACIRTGKAQKLKNELIRVVICMCR